MPKAMLDKMSREELILAVRSYGCGKLKYLPLDFMSKEEIVKHLINCDCPVIRKLIGKQI